MNSGESLSNFKFEPLTYKQLREIFKNENGFTKWLKDNIHYLEEAIGIKFSSKRETFVNLKGGFQVDLRTYIKKNENIVVIVENQLEVSDHKHLGQIITYASQESTCVVVWITESFREEHRNALRQLNENYGEKMFFFGIEVKILQIGSKKTFPSAIEFSVVVEPEAWEEWKLKYHFTTSDSFYYNFWKDIFHQYARAFPDWQMKNPNKYSWIAAYHESSCSIEWSFPGIPSNKHFNVGISIEFEDKEKNTRIFRSLEKKKQQIHDELGFKLDWEEQPENKRCLIYYNHPAFFTIETISTDLRKKLIKWGISHMNRLFMVMSPKLKQALKTN